MKCFELVEEHELEKKIILYMLERSKTEERGNYMTDLFTLTQRQNFQAKRESSWDKSGGNIDSIPILAGETRVLAQLEGPGVISHIWITVASDDMYYLRRLLIRMYWDEEEEPSVEAPLGDFFGLGHSRAYTYNSAPFTCTSNHQGQLCGDINEGAAMNCWLQMPFRKSARIELVNEQPEGKNVNLFYYYIDWQKHPSLPDDTMYLHAQWRRENPTLVKEDNSEECQRMLKDGENLTDRYNYLILNAVGRGHYIGMNMSVDNFSGRWWGEGDDMFFIDRDEGTEEWGGNWPPDLHGTGSEDYLCQAWGMQKAHSLYYGQPWCEADTDDISTHWTNGKVCVYRYHIVDPIPFEKKLRVSIEHGHANDMANDISTVAYWYQAEPHLPFAPILPAEQRLPGKDRFEAENHTSVR